MLSQSYLNSISINFNEMWRQGGVLAKSIRVIDLKELALMYDLEDFLVDVDIPLRLDRDIDLFLATKSKKDIFHLAVTMVVRQHGISEKDRFFSDESLISINELKERTINGSFRKTSKLDSLYDLLLIAYRHCKLLFKELSSFESNRDLFYYLCSIFNAVYAMLLDNKKERFVGYLHVKAILTTIMKQKSTTLIKSYMKTVH